MTYNRPSVPADVARALRKEAGFGCVKCGHPYIEYHHIIAWAEEQHFRPDDMMVLCGNCHPAVGYFGHERQREFKAQPFNVTRGHYRGALEFDKDDLTFKVGGSFYRNVPVILQYGTTPIIACCLSDGQALISLNLFDSAGRRVLSVMDNEITFRVDALWDFEYGHRWAIARSGPRQIALKLDFSSQEATVEGEFWLGRTLAKLGRDYTNLGGGQLVGCAFEDCAVGVQVN